MQADIIATFIAPPEILRIDMARETLQEGERQTLRCLASGQPQPIIKWEFNGSPVSTTFMNEEKPRGSKIQAFIGR